MELQGQIIPSIGILVSTLFFFSLERFRPGRELPNTKTWYSRAIFMNLIQLFMIGIAGVTWNKYFRSHTIFHLGAWSNPALEGFFYWFIGTFVFYWWHRVRHLKYFWQIFHQIHHSPSRIEVLTSFYKHPIEIAADSILIGFIMYTVFGGTGEAGAWYAFYAATGEYFYHSNIKTPHWLGYFIQRPEHHSIHHQLGVHSYNFADLPIWDRMFGTFKDTHKFAPRCGFPRDNEQKMKDMFLFRDVYNR